MAETAWVALGGGLAGELDAARRGIEELAVVLCLDPVVFERHAETLQRFDQLAQVVGEVAGVLRSIAPTEETIAAIRLDAMRERMTAVESKRFE